MFRPWMPASASGSSPGGWGEGHVGERRLGRIRFIPRRLGRGRVTVNEVRAASVHPQAAGERVLPERNNHGHVGSSPGGWGEADTP